MLIFPYLNAKYHAAGVYTYLKTAVACQKDQRSSVDKGILRALSHLAKGGCTRNFQLNLAPARFPRISHGAVDGVGVGL
jgi:hypothetical protein